MIPSRFSIPVSLAWMVLLASGLSPAIGYGQTPFHLEDSEKSYRLDHHIEVYVDSTNNLTVADIIQPHVQKLFKPHNENLTFGYLKENLWLKVSTRCSIPGARWYLEIPAPFLEYVDFFQRQQDSTWQHSRSGYFRKHSERSLSHTGHVLPLIFDSDSLNTSYIQIAGVSPKTFTVNAIEKDKFVQKVRREDLGYGIFFGILFVMMCYNMHLYTTLRQINYLLYVFVIALTCLIFSAISGYGGKFVWPEMPVFNYINGKLALEILIICIAIYTINFLEIRKYSRTMYYLLGALLPLSGLALLLSATHILNSAGNHLITLSTVLFLVSGVIVRIKGNRTGTYFIVSWSFFFLGGMLLTLRNSGVFDFNFWTTHFVEVGAILGVTLMGFGLGAEYRTLQKEKEEAQRVALLMQQEDTARLEMKVKQRTQELHESNRTLQKTLEMNEIQTQIIEKKNDELDSFFQRVSHDLKGPVLSSLALMALAKLDIKDRLALEYIHKQTLQLERLNHIINGLVNLTKLSDNDLQKQKIDFHRIIDDCISSLNHIPNYAQCRFDKDIKSVAFMSDWTLVNAILQNLIENAIKYSRDNAPHIRIRVYEDAQSLVIGVEDNGIGIPPEHQDKIFEMFYRATAEAEGRGLGLYLIKRSIDRLNGTIEIKSEVNAGSTFIVRLPLHTEKEEASQS